MTSSDATYLQQQFSEQTGLSLGLLQRPAIAGFVQRRCQELGLDDAIEYLQLVMRDPLETELLVKEVSVPETWFFRYPNSFGPLIDHCGGLLRGGHDRLKMLSIACATGEEPYSMAMAASQAAWPLERVAIDAIDRHEASLTIARRAVYRNVSFRASVPSWAERWFRTTNDSVQVDARISASVRFLCHDILRGPPPTGRPTYDVVFCRNLFIYLSNSARTKLSLLLASLVAPGGILFVGHAEVPILSDESFQPARVKQAFALHRKLTPLVQSARAGAPPSSLAPSKPRAQTARRQHHRHQMAPPQRSAILSDAGPEPPPQRTLEDARSMADAGQLEEAMAVLESMQPPDSTRPEFFELLGSVQLSLGQLKAARDAFSRVLYFKHDHEEVLLQMAILSVQLGHDKQAARFRRRAMRAHRDEQSQSSEEKQ